MALHNDLGKEGEELATQWLKKNGFDILHRNWRYRQYEIDIVALKDEKPWFVEVKLRSSVAFGWPEQSVTKKKMRFLLQAANEFLAKNPVYRDFRISILSICMQNGKAKDYFFIPDVYL